MTRHISKIKKIIYKKRHTCPHVRWFQSAAAVNFFLTFSNVHLKQDAAVLKHVLGPCQRKVLTGASKLRPAISAPVQSDHIAAVFPHFAKSWNSFDDCWQQERLQKTRTSSGKSWCFKDGWMDGWYSWPELPPTNLSCEGLKKDRNDTHDLLLTNVMNYGITIGSHSALMHRDNMQKLHLCCDAI